MYQLVDRLFCFVVCAPPLYFLFRFLRWYVRQETSQAEEVQAES